MSLADKLKGNLPQVDINKLQRAIDKEIADIKERLKSDLDIKLANIENKLETSVLKATVGVFEGRKGKDGDTITGPQGIQGESIIGPQGEKGDIGIGERGPKGDSVKGDRGPQGERGESIKGKDGKDGSPDTGEEIISKLNSLEITPAKQLDAKHIKNLPKEFKLSKRLQKISRGGGDIVYTEDLTSQTDGSTKTFTVPAHRKVVLVLCPDAPTIYRPTTDFTTSGTTLTLTAQVDAPLSQQTLLFTYVV